MAITYKDLGKLDFPLFFLPSEDWSKSDGLVFINGLVLDDRNQDADSLGVRRLKTPHKPLWKLTRHIDSIEGLLKCGHKNFIDSKGRLFTYEKTKFCSLKYHKIKRVVRKDTASVLYLHGVSTPFTIRRPPEALIQYAGVLYLAGAPWLIYEFSPSKKKDTIRKL